MAQFTIKDLARELGVSASTVSRALHDHPDISDETKRRVVQLAEKKHYQPNQIAKSLQMRRSNTVGVIVPEIRHHFFSTVISGIEEVAYEAGYTIMVCQSNETVAREVLNTQAMVSNRVAGLLIAISTETTSWEHLTGVLQQRIPLVQFDRVVEDLPTSKVVVDDFKAAYEATEHLIERGYRRIGHLSGEQGIALNRNRYGGFVQAMKDHGRQVLPEFVMHVGYREEDGRRGAEAMLAMKERPDAILAINDPVAVGAYVRFREAGLRVPQDVALAGFSDNPEAALVEPGLTTVHQPALEMGRRSFQLLLEQLDHEGPDHRPETEILPTHLVVRGSS